MKAKTLIMGELGFNIGTNPGVSKENSEEECEPDLITPPPRADKPTPSRAVTPFQKIQLAASKRAEQASKRRFKDSEEAWLMCFNVSLKSLPFLS